MDGSALFQTVLDPGERLLWSGQPRKLTLCVAAVNFAGLAVGLVYAFTKTLRLQTAPLPPILELELVLVAAMFAAVGYLLGTRLFRAWNTAYAATDRRLLMAVGPNRTGIRTVLLADLDPVTTEYRPKVGKVLLFRRRGPEHLPVWSFLETGQPDSWKPAWAVSDIDDVRKLIEAARTALSARAA
jgi:hypothetical protein